MGGGCPFRLFPTVSAAGTRNVDDMFRITVVCRARRSAGLVLDVEKRSPMGLEAQGGPSFGPCPPHTPGSAALLY